MIIKKFSIYLISLFIFFYPNIALPNNNIFYLDMDYLMNNSLAGKSIIKKLDEKNILSEKEYLKEVQLFREKVKDYKLSRNKAINQISKIKNDAQRTLLESLTPILKDYAKKNSISYIIPKQNIIIGKKELDITNSILEILNSKIKSIELQ